MNIFDEIKNTKKISADIIQKGTDIYDKLFLRALEFLKKHGPKITQHIFKPSNMTVWTVEGSQNEYLIYPLLFCQCQAFTIGTIYREKKFKPCKHLLAQQLAFALGKYSKSEHKDNEWKKFRSDLLLT